MIHPDVAHTFHIEGVGVSFVASGIVMCCKKGLFGDDRSLEKRLESAYSNYMEWCSANGKVTACRPWDKKYVFDMASNNDFPESIAGKGYDTALCCSWLGHFLESQDCSCFRKNELVHTD